MLDLQKLRMFVAAAHAKNFTRAAEQLDLTQPTVSQQIQTLERELQVTLFERLGRSLELTAAGRALLPHAEQILATERIAEQAVRAAAGISERTLMLGVGNTLGTYVLPDLLQRFGWEHPEFAVHVAMGNTEQVLSQVITGECEVALVGSPHSHAHLLVQQFLSTQLAVIVSPDDQLANRQTIQISELANRQILIRESGSALQAATMNLFQAHQIQPSITVLNNLEAIKRSVEVGLGVAIVPLMVVRREIATQRLVALSILGEDTTRVYNVVHHRDRHITDAARTFMELLQKPLGPDDLEA